ncbi:hypothetical protein [Tunturiibacter gelidiferens]|uniref:hypothetical protein n=1 Tax=Tunturiibacter gelidiferens TaxID=3069689 RepID=UPI003D9AF94F
MCAYDTRPLLNEILPIFAKEIEELLNKRNEPKLAAQIISLAIVDRCKCGEDFCGAFYVEPKPAGAYGPGHRNVELEPESGMIILDVVNDRIMQIEVLYRDEVRRAIQVGDSVASV